MANLGREPRPRDLGLSRVEAVCFEIKALRRPGRYGQLGRHPVGSGLLEDKDRPARPAKMPRLLDSPLTPPAIANGKLFFGSVDRRRSIACRRDPVKNSGAFRSASRWFSSRRSRAGEFTLGPTRAACFASRPATATTTAGSCGGPTRLITVGSSDPARQSRTHAWPNTVLR